MTEASGRRRWAFVSRLLAAAAVVGGPVRDRASAAAPDAPGTRPAGAPAMRPAGAEESGGPLPSGALARFGWARLHHGGWVRYLAFSPDGCLLASCGGQYGQSSEAILWDVRTGRLVRSLAASPQGMGTVDFSPDGKALLGAGTDRTLYVWQVPGGQKADDFQAASAKGNWALFSPDGKAVGISDGANVRILEARSGRLICTIDKASAFAFSPDGRHVVVTSMRDLKMGAEIHDAAAGKRLRQLEGAAEQRYSLPAFSPDGSMVAAGSMLGTDHGMVRIWDARTGKVVRKLGTMGNYAHWVRFSPDGTLLAVASRTGEVRIWTVGTGKLHRELTVPNDRIETVVFSPDGRLLAAAGQTGQIRLWRVGDFSECYDETGHRGTVIDLDASRDGRYVATGGEDGTVRLWQAADGRQLLRLGGSGVKFVSAAISPDGELLAAGTEDSVRLWEAPEGRPVRSVKVAAGATVGLAFLPPGRELVAIGPSLAATLVNVATGQTRLVQAELKTPTALRAALSPDCSVAACFDRNLVDAWEVETGRRRSTFGLGAAPYLYGAAVGPGGWLLAADAGQKVALVELDSGRTIREIPVPHRRSGRGGAMAFSLDEAALALGEMDGSISVWSVRTGQKLLDRHGHRGPITALTFLAGGRRLLSGSGDGTAVMWRLDDIAPPAAPEHAQAGAGILKTLWEGLASDDAVKAHEALFDLAAAGAGAARVLDQELQSVAGPAPKDIRQWVAELGDARFAVRRRATEALARVGSMAEPALREARSQSDSEEVRARAEELLAALDDPSRRNGAVLRQLRAVHALERIGSPEALAVLHKLARGSPRASLTQRAAAALLRLDRYR